MKSLRVSVFIFSTLTVIAAGQDCTVTWDETIPSWFPLIFNASSAQIIYPRRSNNDWKITISENKNVTISCTSDTKNSFNKFEGRNEVPLKCLKSILQVDKQDVRFSDLGCSKQIKEKLAATGTCNNDQFTSADIAFQSNNLKFPLITVCHDQGTDNTIYAHSFIIGGGLNTYELSNNRPSFKEGPFYTRISANDAYTQNSQSNQVALLVGSQELAERYINPKKSFYFARGHLAPDGDFVHIYEQNATYYYVNVVPQWQSINNGNWKALESAARNYAKDRLTDLEIWTGGKDILKLDDVNGNPVEIYLARDSKDSQKLRLPAPELSWKVIQDNDRKASVTVFMINNPHLTTVPDRLRLCEDVCSQVSWVKWDTTNVEKGYTYCCDSKATRIILPFLAKDLKEYPLLT